MSSLNRISRIKGCGEVPKAEVAELLESGDWSIEAHSITVVLLALFYCRA
jgi:hypothetical protein